MRRFLRIVLIVAAALVFLYPILLIIPGSLFSPLDLRESLFREGGPILRLIPRSATADSYYSVLTENPRYVRAFGNSLLYAASITLIGAVISVPAGFALAKYRFPGSTVLTVILIVIMLTPFQVIMVAQYILLKATGLHDTPFAIILPGLFSPYMILFSRQSAVSIPDSLLEAYDLESGSLWHKLKDVVFPSIRPQIIALMILSFAQTWNMLEQPLVFLESPNWQPLSILLSQSAASWAGAGNQLAATVLYMAPLLIMVWVCRSSITEAIEKLRFSS